MRQGPDKSQKIPTRSIIGCYGWFLLMGLGTIYGGFLSMDRANFYSTLDPEEKFILNISHIANLANRQLLPDFRARGYLVGTGKLIDVEIYRKDFERLKPGDQLLVLKIPRQENGFVDASRYQNNKPLFRFFGVPFAWHFFVILALFTITTLALWDLHKKLGYARVQQVRLLASMFYIKSAGAIVILIGYTLRPI